MLPAGIEGVSGVVPPDTRAPEPNDVVVVVVDVDATCTDGKDQNVDVPTCRKATEGVRAPLDNE
jgi:hypothetical protein